MLTADYGLFIYFSTQTKPVELFVKIIPFAKLNECVYFLIYNKRNLQPRRL